MTVISLHQKGHEITLYNAAGELQTSTRESNVAHARSAAFELVGGQPVGWYSVVVYLPTNVRVLQYTNKIEPHFDLFEEGFDFSKSAIRQTG